MTDKEALCWVVKYHVEDLFVPSYGPEISYAFSIQTNELSRIDEELGRMRALGYTPTRWKQEPEVVDELDPKSKHRAERVKFKLFAVSCK